MHVIFPGLEVPGRSLDYTSDFPNQVSIIRALANVLQVCTARHDQNA